MTLEDDIIGVLDNLLTTNGGVKALFPNGRVNLHLVQAGTEPSFPYMVHRFIMGHADSESPFVTGHLFILVSILLGKIKSNYQI